MKKGFKLLGILIAMTGLLTACGSGGGSDDHFVPIVTPTPTITAVAPTSGPPGTEVTITGTNFSTTPANNVVEFFDGITAVVTSSTPTQIVTTVPVGATTGFITVKRGIKTATSSPIIFEVTAPPPATRLIGGSIQGIELSLTNAVTTLAGSGDFGSDDGYGILASFAFPAGITTDGTNLYVADFDNHSIRKIVIATGAVTKLAGSGDFGSDDGIGSAASFNNPDGITTDGTNLYVTDFTGNLIRKIVIATQEVTTFAGTAGTAGAANGIGTAATFNGPNGITTDGTNLYVTEYLGHTIRKIVIATQEVTTFAGKAGTAGAANGIGTVATFNGPVAITTDGTDLYVTDFTGNLIRKIVIANQLVSTFAGSGTAGSANGVGTAATFNGPIGITTDGTNLYVTERFGHLIRKIEIATQIVSTLAGSGDYGSDDGIGTAATFTQPYGITTDGTNLYVADSLSYKIRMIE